MILSGLALVTGCEKQAEATVVPPTDVSVAQPIREQVTDFVEFSGNTAAYASVDVRARVKGFLKKIDFTEGAMVKEGDLLFEISRTSSRRKSIAPKQIKKAPKPVSPKRRRT